MEIIVGVSIALILLLFALLRIKPKKKSFAQQDVMYRPGIKPHQTPSSSKSS